MICRLFSLTVLTLLTCVSLACSPAANNANSVETVPLKANVAENAPLLVAAREGKADVVRALLAGSDVNVNVTDTQGDTPLIEAARFGHDDVARALIEHGADLKAKNNEGQTALTLAARNGHDDVVKRLKEAGAKE